MEIFLHPAAWISLLTLSVMEIVLGIDNIIFISILVSNLPPTRRERLRRIGLLLALIFRVGMLSGLSWIAGMVNPFMTIAGFGVSGRDAILLGGGLFLIIKSSQELLEKINGEDEAAPEKDSTPEKDEEKGGSSLKIISQIIVLDLVFSIDSVVTAIGMSQQLPVMIGAVLIAVGIMIAFAGYVGDFIEKNPTMKVLALAFLVAIGVVLTIEGLHFHFDKNYLYGAMGFSVGVELLNMRMRRMELKKQHKKAEDFNG